MTKKIELSNNSSARTVVGAVIQARLGSTRLPNKIMRPLAGKPLLVHVIERLRRCRRLDRIVLATSTAPSDQKLREIAAAAKIEFFAGSENDVLTRFLGAAQAFKLDVIARICSDSPLIDWVLLDEMIGQVTNQGADYAICDEATEHACEGFEVVSTAALQRVAEVSTDSSDREHVTSYLRRHPARFAFINHPVPEQLQGRFRMSIDVASDLELMRRLYESLYRPGKPIDLREAVGWLRQHPEAARLNAHVRQKPTGANQRRVLIAPGGDRAETAQALAGRLAEAHYCVVTVAGPLNAEQAQELSERGYRVEIAAKADEDRWQKLFIEARPQLVIFAQDALPESLRDELTREGVRLAAIDSPWESIQRALENAED